jgi:signal transduction histidine kinase
MSGVQPLLADALERAADQPDDAHPDGLAPASELADAIARIGDLLVDPDAEPRFDELSPAQRALVRAAADRVRQALLVAAPRHDAEGDALALIGRLEEIRSAATTARDTGLAAQLSGARALDLVIEVAHDLRSPLTSIMFLAETLRLGQSGEVSDTQRQQLGIIYSAALGLLSVANDLMDLARDGETAEVTDFAAEPFSIGALVDSVHAMVRPMLEEKRLYLVFRLPDQDRRLGKPIPLGRALLNLVTNAIKFTDAGRVEVVARPATGDTVEFSVLDSGRGMDDGSVRALYEAFRPGRTETGYRFSDTGLGMAVCRRMVGIMGGELHVESEPGKGTRFWFEIELPVAEHDSGEARTAHGGGPPGAEAASSSGDQGTGDGGSGREGD